MKPKAPAVDAEAIAAIVPTLNEGARIGKLIDSLERAGIDEIIVADGGSADDTLALCSGRANVATLTSPKGRGAQITAGANAAQAPILWIVHADSAPPANAGDLIRKTLRDPSVALGCFRLSFDDRHPLLSLYAFASRIDSAATTFGDQGFFMRRADYESVGGAPAWPLFEDVELRRRLRPRGAVAKLDAPLITSARRFRLRGVARQQILNGWLLFRFWTGAPPDALAKIYEGVTRAGKRRSSRDRPLS
ncbi:MAG: TIGR04283 family arsenosugar biosynthesis glycosyltransferase [Pseudomonadota bacterium]